MKIIEPSVELIDPIVGVEGAILRRLEEIGRTCYKSEDKLTATSAADFVRRLIASGHHSVLEHVSLSVRFTVDRGVSHEIVRHRIASYSQESTRYCVAGDMKLHTTNPHNRPTVKELYENSIASKNGAWKRVLVEQYDDYSGELVYSHIKNIFYTGEKPCLSIRTRLGYEIVCTPDHEVLADDGYVKAESLDIGQKIMVNGTEALYRNKAWLYHQNIELNKTFVCIAKEFGFNANTLKKWAKKHGLPKKGTGYFNVGRTAWNHGVRDDRQVEALRTYHHCGRRNDKILKDDTVCYQKHKANSCAVCGAEEDLHVHHIDGERGHNDASNLITLCPSCHQRVHSQNLTVAYADEIVSVEPAGVRAVYDIEMDSKHHNFVANGVVVHNCNYSQDKFGNEITVIRPCYFEEGSGSYVVWEAACRVAEKAYFGLLKQGCKPEEARAVLPMSLKTELVMTANLREWRYFLALRTAKACHPQMRQAAGMLLDVLAFSLPVIFGDLQHRQVAKEEE